MAEPAAKKAKTEAAAEGEAPEAKEPEAPVEQEQDAKADKGPRIKGDVVFHPKDTTLNVMRSAVGNVLMPLTDGGLQYLLAGARASVGVKSGRYLFEVKIVEAMNPLDDPAARQKTPMPRCQFRVGFSTAGSSLFLGETEDSICFDAEGALTHNRTKTPCSQKFGGDCVVSVLLNLDSASPNANTVSLFKDGVRASQPQALPEALRGKALYPALTFKNVTVQYNFGPALAPLPFACRSVSDASVKDAVVTPAPTPPKDGKYEVLFPVCLPDEGAFDWLDMFLQKHPEYVELSDRAILAWAEKSGLARPKGYAARSSNDKPEMGFGIGAMDDHSVRRVLQHVAPVQPRHFVVMEVKSNLVKQERTELLSRWAVPGFRKVALVLMADPPADFRKRSQELALKTKQDAADVEFKAKQEEEKRKKALEKRQKQLEKDRAKTLKKQQKAAEEFKRKMEIEKKKKEAAANGEEYKEEEDEEMKPKEDEPEEEEEKEEEEAEEQMDEDPPKVTLTAEEKKLVFRKIAVPDLTSYALSTSFTKFTIPDKDEGFDEVRCDWAPAAKCKEYLKQWVQDKKTTTRIEDLQPGEWFTCRWKEWQKCLSAWHAKQNAYKALVAKRIQEQAAKQAKRAAVRDARAKAAAAKEDKPAEEPPAEEPAEEEDEDDKDEKVDFDKLDVFAVEDILDVGGGEPLFSTFGFEDWTMMALRFELHLLAHAFKRDVNDPDRIGIHVEHLSFYYNKYFKKALSHKFYGVETVQELLDLLRDTVVVTRKGKVVEPQLPDDMESYGVFIMLTEECRRDRVRRVDSGDDSARLKL
eukprot:CAMPEP_0198529256 /NCGR_PEP_ID=MMETSP1462-20131121/25646_1 /TAXON_ID=1333877 /ORGANISM="Brandtodinium nutriculum, Strain RCC3387" /LENGTH=808 /DNA_ID=CAMNT_0044259097 /DNA_START=1 /DNA_END=2423 /DNA_ORIENTATION=+